jgi:hypothetical protein
MADQYVEEYDEGPVDDKEESDVINAALDEDEVEEPGDEEESRETEDEDDGEVRIWGRRRRSHCQAPMLRASLPNDPVRRRSSRQPVLRHRGRRRWTGRSPGRKKLG